VRDDVGDRTPAILAGILDDFGVIAVTIKRNQIRR
jgi:hypothetical protein